MNYVAGTMIVVFCDTKLLSFQALHTLSIHAHIWHWVSTLLMHVRNLHKLTCRETLAIKTALEGSSRA